jgi:hypothetical protein
MILAVIGSREFDNYPWLCQELDRVHARRPITKIVSGGARGADRLGARYARERGIELQEFLAKWEVYNEQTGKLEKDLGAGHARNTDIINAVEGVVAFWDGRSPGTNNSIKKAEKRGIPVHIVRFQLTG